MTDIVIAWKAEDGNISGMLINEDGTERLGMLMYSDHLNDLLVDHGARVILMTVEQSDVRPGVMSQHNRVRGFIQMNVDRPDEVNPPDPSPGWKVAEAIERDFKNFYENMVELWGDYSPGTLSRVLN